MGGKQSSGVANTKVKNKEKDGRCKIENIHRKKENIFYMHIKLGISITSPKLMSRTSGTILLVVKV